jgi:hypothetical protein
MARAGSRTASSRNCGVVSNTAHSGARQSVIRRHETGPAAGATRASSSLYAAVRATASTVCRSCSVVAALQQLELVTWCACAGRLQRTNYQRQPIASERVCDMQRAVVEQPATTWRWLQAQLELCDTTLRLSVYRGYCTCTACGICSPSLPLQVSFRNCRKHHHRHVTRQMQNHVRSC